MKVSITQANLERHLAVQQLTRVRQELDQLDRDRHAVCHMNSFISLQNNSCCGMLIQVSVLSYKLQLIKVCYQQLYSTICIMVGNIYSFISLLSSFSGLCDKLV